MNSSYLTNKFIISGLVLSIAVAANFPANALGFTGLDGLSLDLGALSNFL